MTQASCDLFLTPFLGNNFTLSIPRNWNLDKVMASPRYRFMVIIKLLSSVECGAILPQQKWGS